MGRGPYPKLWKRLTLKEKNERNDKICKLWTEGMEVSVLGERFGLSGESVRNILKGAGRWIRSPS